MTDQKLETVLELALSTDEAQREQSNTLDVGYDPATKRWELIVKYSGSPVFPDFVTFFPLFGGYAIVSVPENYIPTLSEMPEIEYIEKPKNLVLSLYEARAASCITPVQNPPLSLDGSGVLVGIVDSGIDVFHPDFRNEDGTTRIRELWDQTVPNETESFFNRGRIFTSEDINRALAENDRSFPSRDLSLAKPDIAAPGVDILSTAPGGGYTRNTGTSMATPFVTGSAALLMQYGIVQNRDPYLYGQKVKAYLQRGARHIPAEKNYPSPMIGWGALCLKDSLPG